MNENSKTGTDNALDDSGTSPPVSSAPDRGNVSTSPRPKSRGKYLFRIGDLIFQPPTGELGWIVYDNTRGLIDPETGELDGVDHGYRCRYAAGTPAQLAHAHTFAAHPDRGMGLVLPGDEENAINAVQGAIDRAIVKCGVDWPAVNEEAFSEYFAELDRRAHEASQRSQG